ncbi:hypothetical protein H0H87_001110 [Tephrocybe sp. NHM501043]|nr:hypothetical protein H0H87_001110 [Tephrocybe sp. NHM501043]
MGRRPSPTASKQSKGTRTISPEQEKAIERAHLEFKSGVFKHVSEAAQAHDVPYHTLLRRVKGLTRPKSDAHKGQRLLSTEEEETLVDWLKYLALTGHPVTRRTP